jgi:hypothetical protein
MSLFFEILLDCENLHVKFLCLFWWFWREELRIRRRRGMRVLLGNFERKEKERNYVKKHHHKPINKY